MKKIILIITAVLLCGCSFNSKDEYEGYKRYQFEPSKIFHIGNIGDKTYALAYYENSSKTGIFYQINANEYILLNEIPSCGDDRSPEGSSYNYFFENKLYLIRCSGKSIMEYTINDLDAQMKELKFDESKVINNVPRDGHEHWFKNHRIEKVDDKYIYFKVDISNGYLKDIKVKCSFEDLKCEEYK